MYSDIIDFAQWYSGMERPKVEAAYRRYLKEREKELAKVKIPCKITGCDNDSTSANGLCLKHFTEHMNNYFNENCT